MVVENRGRKTVFYVPEVLCLFTQRRGVPECRVLSVCLVVDATWRQRTYKVRRRVRNRQPQGRVTRGVGSELLLNRVKVVGSPTSVRSPLRTRIPVHRVPSPPKCLSGTHPGFPFGVPQSHKRTYLRRLKWSAGPFLCRPVFCSSRDPSNRTDPHPRHPGSAQPPLMAPAVNFSHS